MAQITAGLVKELRERTGAGMMDCKKALAATEGDMDKAIDFLREKGLAAAAKKAGRIAAEGLVVSYVSEDHKVGVIVEVNCETDFVAKTENFQELVAGIAAHVAKSNPADMDALNASEIEEGKTVAALITESIAKIGENISLRRFARYEAAEGMVAAYIHGGGKIGGGAAYLAPCDILFAFGAVKPGTESHIRGIGKYRVKLSSAGDGVEQGFIDLLRKPVPHHVLAENVRSENVRSSSFNLHSKSNLLVYNKNIIYHSVLIVKYFFVFFIFFSCKYLFKSSINLKS